ncbi:MAG: proline--tRNA ligase [Bdellovibrionaceae bacterium]|nr:proline--tRNA ligase [Pseudobdellovibrionaceae bacterium]
MKWSKSYLYTLKDAPADAEIPSHQLMVRSGMIRKVAPGIYTYGNLALRALRKLETIIREELDKRGCQEILMPMVHPAELWQETNRWSEMGDGLLKFENRNGHKFCLGATHEEVITDYVRKDIKSYRDMPANLYQIQTKYRDEIRPRFGLMRGREFVMKDAYSFDADSKGALKSYDTMYAGYKAIFDRIGLQYRIVEADAGNIGGSQTHEFQVLAEAGEDHLMVCDSCDFAANIEVAPAADKVPHLSADTTEKTLEEFATPGLKSIGTLSKATGVAERDLVKTMFFSANDGRDPQNKDLKPVAVLLRGSDEVNPVKLKNALGLVNPPLLLTDNEVKEVTGAWPGSCGPVGLKFPIYMDTGVAGLKNFIVGANKDAFHLRHVNAGRDFAVTKTVDLRLARVGDKCPKCSAGVFKSMRGIEVGHVFYLGTKYSKTMNATFLREDGSSHPIEMGCYGIGVSRTVQAAVEQSHDKDGIIWPVGIAPFHVHIVVLDPDNSEVSQSAEIIYRDLMAHGLDVFMDDRAERPGVKFKDADLLGMPIRINIGGRGLQNGEVEIILRKTKEMTKVKLESAVESVAAMVTQMKRASLQS